MPTTLRPYALSQVRGLTAEEVARLSKQGIRNTADLLVAAPTPSKERSLATRAGVAPAQVREAVNRADLMRVRGIGSATADLFENAGVNSAAELSYRNANSLAQGLVKYAEAHPEQKYRPPGAATVSTLVERARQTVAAAGPGAPSPAVVAKHLKIAVVSWYVKNADALPPGAQTSFAAQMAVTAAKVAEVKDPEDDPFRHDLAKFQVFSHSDVVFPGSGRVWYAAFERGTGKFVEAYSWN
jgi:hypothetical protein